MPFQVTSRGLTVDGGRFEKTADEYTGQAFGVRAPVKEGGDVV